MQSMTGNQLWLFQWLLIDYFFVYASYLMWGVTLNWASGGPVTITILIFDSGDSAGAIWREEIHSKLLDSHRKLRRSTSCSFLWPDIHQKQLDIISKHIKKKLFTEKLRKV